MSGKPKNKERVFMSLNEDIVKKLDELCSRFNDMKKSDMVSILVVLASRESCKCILSEFVTEHQAQKKK